MTAPDRARLREIRKWARGCTVYEGSDAQKVHELLDALDVYENALREIESRRLRVELSDEAACHEARVAMQTIAREALARIGAE